MNELRKIIDAHNATTRVLHALLNSRNWHDTPDLDCSVLNGTGAFGATGKAVNKVDEEASSKIHPRWRQVDGERIEDIFSHGVKHEGSTNTDRLFRATNHIVQGAITGVDYDGENGSMTGRWTGTQAEANLAEINRVNEAKYQHGDDAYKKGVRDGKAEHNAERESYLRMLHTERETHRNNVEALQQERTMLLSQIAMLQSDMKRINEAYDEFEKHLHDIRTQRDNATKLVEHLTNDNEVLSLAKSQYESALEDMTTAYVRVEELLRESNEQRTALRTEISKVAEHLVEHTKPNVLWDLLKYTDKQTTLYHNYRALPGGEREHGRVMQFTPLHVYCDTRKAPEPIYVIVGINGLSGQHHHFTADQIDSYEAPK